MCLKDIPSVCHYIASIGIERQRFDRTNAFVVRAQDDIQCSRERGKAQEKEGRNRRSLLIGARERQRVNSIVAVQVFVKDTACFQYDTLDRRPYSFRSTAGAALQSLL